MPKTTNTFKVFLASPSDVSADRESIAQTIEELNRIVASRSIQFELVRWETHSTPAIAIDYSQQIINTQLLGDIDIMIAVFGTRLGSPTPAATSATVEEVQFMLNLKDHPMKENRLMVFFKRIKVDNLNCDLDQLKALREFRAELQGNKVFYKEFEKDEDLKDTVRRSLIRATEIHVNSVPNNSNDDLNITPYEIDELGILDHQHFYETGLEEVGKHLSEGTRLIEEFGEESSSNASLISAAQTIGSTAQILTAINSQADMMDRCADAMSSEFASARTSMEKALFHALELVNLQLEDFSVDVNETKNSWTETIISLENTIAETREQFSGFRQAILGVPRVSKRLNMARRKLLSALDQFDVLLDQTISSASAIKARVNVALL